MDINMSSCIGSDLQQCQYFSTALNLFATLDMIY